MSPALDAASGRRRPSRARASTRGPTSDLACRPGGPGIVFTPASTSRAAADPGALSESRRGTPHGHCSKGIPIPQPVEHCSPLMGPTVRRPTVELRRAADSEPGASTYFEALEQAGPTETSGDLSPDGPGAVHVTNTMPGPPGRAGRSPRCGPRVEARAETAVFFRMPRLGLDSSVRRTSTELVHDMREPVQRALGLRKNSDGYAPVADTVAPGSMSPITPPCTVTRARARSSRGRPVPPAGRKTSSRRAATRDPRLARDEAARADSTVVPDLTRLSIFVPGPPRVVHAAAVDRRVGPISTSSR